MSCLLESFFSNDCLSESASASMLGFLVGWLGNPRVVDKMTCRNCHKEYQWVQEYMRGVLYQSDISKKLVSSIMNHLILWNQIKTKKVRAAHKCVVA